MRADLISRTDLRIHGEIKMRDELLARIDALQQQVEAAKEEGEDNAVSAVHRFGCIVKTEGRTARRTASGRLLC